MNRDSNHPNVWKDIGYPVVRDVLKMVLPYLIVGLIIFFGGWWLLDTYVLSPGREVVETVSSATSTAGEAISSTYEAGKEAASNAYEAGKEGVSNAVEATKEFGADMLEKAKDMIPGGEEEASAEAPSPEAKPAPDSKEDTCWHSFAWKC